MKRLLLSFLALGLANCATFLGSGIQPQEPVAIDWEKCDTEHLTFPESDATWVWREDAILLEQANHACIDIAAKAAEENARIARVNRTAYEQKDAPFPERIGYWFQGWAGINGALAVFYLLTLL